MVTDILVRGTDEITITGFFPKRLWCDAPVNVIYIFTSPMYLAAEQRNI